MCGLDHGTILFSFFSFMKRYLILSYLVFSMVVSLPCVGQDARNTAKKLNASIDRQLGNLPSIQSDTAAYYKAIVQLMKYAITSMQRQIRKAEVIPVTAIPIISGCQLTSLC